MSTKQNHLMFKRYSHIRLVIFLPVMLFVLTLVLAGCDPIPHSPSELQTPTAPFNARADFTPVPTYTPTPEDAPELPDKPEPPKPTATEDLFPPTVVVNTEANLRQGPGTAYPVVGQHKPGDHVEALEQSADGQWLRLGRDVWIYRPLVDGETLDLPIARDSAPPPKIDPTPSSPTHKAEHALSEFFPWFHNPPDDNHAAVVQPLTEVWLKDAELGRELARAPWLADGIDLKEYNPIYGLSNLFDLNPELARRMLAYSMEEPVQDRNVMLLSALGDMTWQNPEDLNLLILQPWFTDGLSAEERAFVVALANVAGSSALFRDLLAARYTQSATVSLPLAGEVRLWAFHHAPLSHGPDITAMMEHSVRGVERLMATPFPLSDVILLLVNAPEYGQTALGGVNMGDSLVVFRDSEGFSLAELLHHEIAHFYFAFEIGPFWLVEGGANFAQAYIRAWDGAADWIGTVPRDEHIKTACTENGVPNVHALSDPDPPDRMWQSTCQYGLGQYFLTSLFNTLGPTAFSAALGELYGSYRQLQFYPAEEQVYRTFLSHAPPDREAAFLEDYRRLHGGPFLD